MVCLSDEYEMRVTTGWQDYRAWRDNQAGSASRHTVVGNLQVLPDFPSPELGNTRDILVYLPPSYGTTTRRYPVIYMQDGQNLFDEATSYAGEWQVDETMELLSQVGIEAIVVGIPNRGVERLDEYSPYVDRARGGGKGDRYADFVVHTLKPRIDQDFRTDREHCGIMGSSMGALISLYTFLRHPQVFGFVGAMSPAFWFGKRTIFADVQGAPFVPGRIYLDIGTREGPAMVRDTRRMEGLLRVKGYRPDHDLSYVEEHGAFHQEAAWARRLPAALSFLLGRGLTVRPDSAPVPHHVNLGSS